MNKLTSVMNVISRIFNTPWNLVRMIRLALGIAFMGDAWYMASELVGLMGVFLVYQALFNLGCSSSFCSTSNTEEAHPNDWSNNFIKINNQNKK